MEPQPPSQTLEKQFMSSDTRRAPLSETIRLGAQLMLQKAVELEVTEFLGRDNYQRGEDGLLRGYRDGYEDKLAQTAEGPLSLKMVDASAGWRGVKITRAISRELDSLKADSTAKPAVRLAA